MSSAFGLLGMQSLNLFLSTLAGSRPPLHCSLLGDAVNDSNICQLSKQIDHGLWNWDEKLGRNVGLAEFSKFISKVLS